MLLQGLWYWGWEFGLPDPDLPIPALSAFWGWRFGSWLLDSETLYLESSRPTPTPFQRVLFLLRGPPLRPRVASAARH